MQISYLYENMLHQSKEIFKYKNESTLSSSASSSIYTFENWNTAWNKTRQKNYKIIKINTLKIPFSIDQIPNKIQRIENREKNAVHKQHELTNININ